MSRDYLNDEASFEEEVNKASTPMLRLGKVKSKLFLDCVSDRDEAEYTCVAETPYERISQSTFLKMGKFKFHFFSFKDMKVGTQLMINFCNTESFFS